MKIKLLLLLLLAFQINQMSAQRELWGISKGYDSFDPEFPDNYGNIFK